MDGKVMSKKTCKQALIQDWNERVFVQMPSFISLTVLQWLNLNMLQSHYLKRVDGISLFTFILYACPSGFSCQTDQPGVQLCDLIVLLQQRLLHLLSLEGFINAFPNSKTCKNQANQIFQIMQSNRCKNTPSPSSQPRLADPAISPVYKHFCFPHLRLLELPLQSVDFLSATNMCWVNVHRNSQCVQEADCRRHACSELALSS